MIGVNLAATLRRGRQGGGGYTLRFLSADTGAGTQTYEVNVPNPHLRRVSRGPIISVFTLNPDTTNVVSSVDGITTFEAL